MSPGPHGDFCCRATDQGGTVSAKSRIAGVLTGVIAMCSATSTASAVALPATQPAAQAAANVTESTGGPIRECFRKSCRVIITVPPGTKLVWTHFAVNPVGNRWYFVKDAEQNENFSGGWIYCGNVTAGC
jgi:hypothetical protein